MAGWLTSTFIMLAHLLLTQFVCFAKVLSGGLLLCECFDPTALPNFSLATPSLIKASYARKLRIFKAIFGHATQYSHSASTPTPPLVFAS
jgi:hypothetical protein